MNILDIRTRTFYLYDATPVVYIVPECCPVPSQVVPFKLANNTGPQEFDHAFIRVSSDLERGLFISRLCREFPEPIIVTENVEQTARFLPKVPIRALVGEIFPVPQKYTKDTPVRLFEKPETQKYNAEYYTQVFQNTLEQLRNIFTGSPECIPKKQAKLESLLRNWAAGQITKAK